MPFNDVIYRIAASMLKDSKIISAFLEINSIVDRYYSLYEFIINHINILKIKSEIEEKVRDRVNKNQKEYYLREQLRVITQELGDEEPVNEYLIYQEKLKALDIDAEIKRKNCSRNKKIQIVCCNVTTEKEQFKKIIWIQFLTIRGIFMIRNERVLY